MGGRGHTGRTPLRTEGERGWEALVAWKGPFEDSWVHMRDLCGPAKAETREMAERLFPRHRRTLNAPRANKDVTIGASLSLPRRCSPRLIALREAEANVAGGVEPVGEGAVRVATGSGSKKRVRQDELNDQGVVIAAGASEAAHESDMF